MLNLITQHTAIRLACLLFIFRQTLPAASQEFVAPTRAKYGVILIRRFRRVGFGFGDVGMHRHFAAALFGAPLIVDNQAINDGLYKRAESAALRVGIAEIAAHKSKRELLEDFLGGIFVAKGR